MPKREGEKTASETSKRAKKKQENHNILPPGQEELELETLVFGGNSLDNVQTSLERAGTELQPASEEEGFFIDTSAAEPQETEAETDTVETEQAAWVDDGQEHELVDIQSSNRLRKLKTTFEEFQVGGSEYELRLRAQFQKINPTPDWAKVAVADAAEKDEIFTTTQNLVRSAPSLNPDKLVVVRVKDANQAEYSNVTVQAVAFHPRAPVLLTAGLDKTLRLFHIDGKENPKVQSFHIKDMPIISAHFSNDGSQIVMTGRRNFFYSLDLGSGSVTRTTGIRGTAGLLTSKADKKE
ncbi:U3 snoRNP protein, partial [Kappamyces sp. JEL0680]